MKMSRREGRQFRPLGVLRVLRVLAPILFVASIAKELRKPAAERTWHGQILGFVPYDFRPPTPERLKESFWNPDDHHLLTSRPLGVGWAINLYELRRRLMPSGGGGDGDGGMPVEMGMPAAA